MTSISPRHLLDMLAEVADPRKQKTPPPVSRDACAHGCRSPMWLTQLYSDCQMGTPSPCAATCLGIHGETNRGSINLSLSLSAS